MLLAASRAGFASKMSGAHRSLVRGQIEMLFAPFLPIFPRIFSVPSYCTGIPLMSSWKDRKDRVPSAIAQCNPRSIRVAFLSRPRGEKIEFLVERSFRNNNSIAAGCSHTKEAGYRDRSESGALPEKGNRKREKCRIRIRSGPIGGSVDRTGRSFDSLEDDIEWNLEYKLFPEPRDFSFSTVVISPRFFRLSNTRTIKLLLIFYIVRTGVPILKTQTRVYR